MVKVAINGFGRIGRVSLRIILERIKSQSTPIQVVAINDCAPLETLAYLLKYDSVHGKCQDEITIEGSYLHVNGNAIKVFCSKDPSTLPWKDLGVDVVLESTGVFLTRESAQKHLEAGAKKVLLSAPAKSASDVDATLCFGVNNQALKSEMKILSTASCTTNCLAPIAKVLDENFGIENALVTTIHSYTNDQQLLDLPHTDKRRARAAGLSMIPTTTGALKAMSLVIPKLEGRFDGLSVRVPTPNVSLIDMVVTTQKHVSVKDVNYALLQASQNELKGVLGYCSEPLVSSDFNGTKESSIIDSLSTMVLGQNMVKVLSWYDNEYGFANRAVDLLEVIGS